MFEIKAAAASKQPESMRTARPAVLSCDMSDGQDSANISVLWIGLVDFRVLTSDHNNVTSNESTDILHHLVVEKEQIRLRTCCGVAAVREFVSYVACAWEPSIFGHTNYSNSCTVTPVLVLTPLK